MGKGGSSPDVQGAARVEGIENRKTARDATYANRPDQYNPFGGIRWSQETTTDPGSGEEVTRWVQRQNLGAPYQKLLDDQTDSLQTLSGMQGASLSRAAQDLRGGPDFEQFGAASGLEFDASELRQRAEDAAYQRSTSRLDPRFGQRRNDMEIKLRNQGLRPGEEAYDRAMGNLNRAENDAYEQARRGAVGTGRTEQQQAFGQQMQSTDFANALRDKNIEEYLGQRRYNLEEADLLDPTARVAGVQGSFAGG